MPSPGPGPDPGKSSRDLLFVAGLARSGTTALRDVLSAHPEVALGLERYNRLLGRGGPDRLTGEMFDKDRFFDLSDPVTGLPPEYVVEFGDVYAELAAKWDTARYVGDKLTTIHFDRLREIHPDARFVFIVRDIVEVAPSWDRRAADPSDRYWSPTSDAFSAVRRWNAALRRIRKAVRHHRDRAVVVEHARFFGDPEARSLRAVLSLLHLPWEPAVERAFREAHETYVGSLAGRSRPLSEEARAFIAQHADRRLWEVVCRLAV